MAATGIVGDGPLFLVDYLLRFMRVALLLAIWRTLFRARPQVAGLPLAAVLTYTLIAEVFSEPLGGYTGLADSFWDGTIGSRFLRPMNVFAQYAVEAGGQWLVNFALFSVPLLLCARLFGVDPSPAGPVAAGYFAVSLTLAVAVGLALDYMAGAVAVILEMTPMVIERTRRAIGGLLSGAVIPLALMPWSIGRVLAWTPFASLASAPLQIYVGRGDPLRLILLQGFWAIVLWAAARRIWNRARERMVSYGG